MCRKSRLQRREGEFIDAQGAIEGVLPKPLDDFSATDNQPSLRCPEQFVAAKGNDISSIGNASLDDWFILQTIIDKIPQDS